MKKFLVLIAVVALTGCMAVQAQQSGQKSDQPPQAKPDQKPDDKAMPNVAGKWTMTLEMSMGTGTPTLELKQEADKVTGTYTGRYGTFALQGKLKGRAIEFAVTMQAEGQTVTLSFAGEVAADGQTMKGQATMEGLDDATWTAKKIKTPGNQR